MILCQCRTVTEQEVRDAVRAGANTRRKVARCCGAGDECGGCAPLIDQIVAEERSDRAEAGVAGLELAPAP